MCPVFLSLVRCVGRGGMEKKRAEEAGREEPISFGGLLPIYIGCRMF